MTDPGPGDPGRLLAEGRSARVYLIEDGWLLRRFRDQRQDVTTEATVLRWAARHGVPVPAVHGAAGPDLVIEHVHGPSMLTALLDDPSGGSGYGRTLAELHRRLDGSPHRRSCRLPPGSPAGCCTETSIPATSCSRTAGRS